MAWLHSPFTRQQGLGESGGSNLRKGYKVTSNKDCDPDNSDTPLLFDAPPSKTEQKSLNTDWFGNTSLASKNQAISKTSLPTSFFQKSGNSGKSQMTSISQEANIMQLQSKQTEDKKLLNYNEKKNKEFQDEEEDESEDEWCVPKSGGYHKVRSGAD
ncbi:uncharacterized protein [Parasteatoda tepidariorum]|uniref:uncharacterized protein n=1 Tax=Parasteatoda tepidariorum TaxID=114398 RepID=UPI00077FB030|nr:uncharacterized protein LOC107451993 [Parasteatoda tepidariorum]XP_042899247.1 uncharacterized protein LOC107451993 [Parasteatoda tepidariorum]XP_042899248.1 uncharacterized protein LOC107451993 [Parasteatoda tepidariorum]